MLQDEQAKSIQKFGSENQLKEYLVDDALDKYSNLFGTSGSYGWYYPYATTDVGISLDTTFSAAETDSLSVSGNLASASFSETNTQEEGVDEADLVETDGQFIYQVTGQTLTIVDARNSDQLKIASQTDLKDLGNVQGAYLYEDQLTVISTEFPRIFWGGNLWDNSIEYPKSTVNVTVLDVSNPKSVEIEETSKLEGGLVSSRAVGDQVYVVTTDSFGLPAPKIEYEYDTPKFEATLDTSSSDTVSLDLSAEASLVATDSLSYPWWGPTSYSYETEEEYLKRIKGQELELALPEFTTIDEDGKVLKEGVLNQATNVYRPLEENPYRLTSVSVFDVDDNKPGPQDSSGIPGVGFSQTYASQDNLYLLQNDWSPQQQTNILKVNLDSLDLVAKGDAPGRILDQFSADEEKGYFRVATTTGWGRNAENGVYVLEQDGQDLDIVGSVDGIAKGETIHSARFEGDYGFVVTFRQVDPFFTIDLSDPTDPEVAGELKLPGFSEYLQVIEEGDRTQVLGIGRESRDLKVSLFDATDFDDPEEVDSYKFDGRYSGSEAQWDHRAVGYYGNTDTLAIPFYNSNREQGLRVFDVDPEDGFDERGDITHDGARIRRSLVIDDELYAISSDKVTVHDIETLELVDEIVVPESNSSPYSPYISGGANVTISEDLLGVSGSLTVASDLSLF